MTDQRDKGEDAAFEAVCHRLLDHLSSPTQITKATETFQIVFTAGRLAERAEVVAMVEAEPELPGPMPDENWELCRQLLDREGIAEMLRMAVRKTKELIIQRLTVRGEGEDGDQG